MAEQKKSNFYEFTKGLIRENPTLVTLLGMCPTLAVTTMASNGIGMGLGFTLALTVIGLIRELFGAGTVFGVKVMPDFYTPVAILVMAPGAFFVLAILSALQNKLHAPSATNGQHSELACGGDCAHCAGCAGAANHLQVAEETERQARLLAEQRKAAAEAKKAAEQAKKQEGGEQV